MGFGVGKNGNCGGSAGVVELWMGSGVGWCCFGGSGRKAVEKHNDSGGGNGGQRGADGDLLWAGGWGDLSARAHFEGDEGSGDRD